jgi:hypothetical protein
MKKILIFSFICFSQSLLAIYTCRDYATRARQQGYTNLKLSCGYTEGRWHTNWEDHYSWCNRVGVNAARVEDVARFTSLENCIERCVENCSSYATRAVRQNEAALTLNCGFTGGGWQSDFNNHYNWCLTASPEQINKEDWIRRSKLRSCMVFPSTLFGILK